MVSTPNRKRNPQDSRGKEKARMNVFAIIAEMIGTIEQMKLLSVEGGEQHKNILKLEQQVNRLAEAVTKEEVANGSSQ